MQPCKLMQPLKGCNGQMVCNRQNIWSVESRHIKHGSAQTAPGGRRKDLVVPLSERGRSDEWWPGMAQLWGPEMWVLYRRSRAEKHMATKRQLCHWQERRSQKQRCTVWTEGKQLKSRKRDFHWSHRAYCATDGSSWRCCLSTDWIFVTETWKLKHKRTKFYQLMALKDLTWTEKDVYWNEQRSRDPTRYPSILWILRVSG